MTVKEMLANFKDDRFEVEVYMKEPDDFGASYTGFRYGKDAIADLIPLLEKEVFCYVISPAYSRLTLMVKED